MGYVSNYITLNLFNSLHLGKSKITNKMEGRIIFNNLVLDVQTIRTEEIGTAHLLNEQLSTAEEFCNWSNTHSSALILRMRCHNWKLG